MLGFQILASFELGNSELKPKFLGDDRDKHGSQNCNHYELEPISIQNAIRESIYWYDIVRQKDRVVLETTFIPIGSFLTEPSARTGTPCRDMCSIKEADIHGISLADQKNPEHQTITNLMNDR